MDSKINYTVVGIFVVGLTIALVVIFLWLTTTRNDKSYKTYLIYINENVTGLTVQSPVRYNGVPVGYVTSIELDPRNPQLVKIVVNIEVGTPITTSTVATLQLQGITGVMYVGLKATSMDAPLLQPESGQKYPVIRAEPSFFVQISEVVPELTKNIQTIGKSVSKLLNDQNQEAISKSLQNIQKFSETLSKNSENLDDIMKKLRITMNNTSEASKDFPRIAKDLKKTIDSISETSDRVGKAANEAQKTFTSGTVVMRDLSTQLLPGTQQLLMHLNNAARNINHLTEDLQSNPSMLIRGKVPAAKGPGE